MITVKTNIDQVTQGLIGKFKNMEANVGDKLLRVIATTELEETRNRIHNEGKKADSSQIGTYKNPYLARRQKKPYNRTGDTKMIFVLTGKMEREYAVIATAKGYGLGWNSGSGNGISNFDKAKYLEEKKGVVYNLTKKEQDLIPPIITQFIKDNLK